MVVDEQNLAYEVNWWFWRIRGPSPTRIVQPFGDIFQDCFTIYNFNLRDAYF